MDNSFRKTFICHETQSASFRVLCVFNKHTHTAFCFVFGLGLMVIIHNASMLRYEYVNCVCSYVGVDVVVGW